MKIAIHDRPGSFSDFWIPFCREKNISHKIVNCYDSDIVEQLADCDALMWHHSHARYEDQLFAKQLTFSLEKSGKKVFPDSDTSWHFDDKVGQKYLLESIGAPLVPSYVFYTKKTALNWINTTNFPKVFKLRGGAGSSNVKLVSSRQEAFRIIRKAFGRGFSQFNRWEYFRERRRKVRSGKDGLVGVFKGLARLLVPISLAKMKGPEKGYAYFQDFIPANDSDTRVIVIGNKAFGIKRLVRKNDFRASGSGVILHDREEIDERCVQLAFDISRKLNCSCMAYDFVFDEESEPLVVEMSYGFAPAGYKDCPGYWDDLMHWHEKPFNPYGWMVEGMIVFEGNAKKHLG